MKTDLLTVGEQLAVNVERVEAAIQATWEKLDAHQAAGRLTDNQYRHLLAQEMAWGDDGTDATRWVFSKFLAAQANAPRSVGINVNDAPFKCLCEDVGWYYDDETRKFSPCARCNVAAYDLWSAGCLKPNHSCEKCAPKKKRRAPGKSHDDEAVEDRAARGQQVEDDQIGELF